MSRRYRILPGLLVLIAPLHAAPPEFGAIFPPGGRVGTTFNITSTVKNTSTTKWWTSAPKVTFGPTDKPEVWTVTIPPDTPIGLYPIVRHNDAGVSSTRWFSIGRFPEIEETEPNNEIANGQQISSLPVCINARLGQGNDVDHFRISLKAGQTLVAMVEAYGLGSPVDVIAHVVAPNGKRSATASDARNLDPFFGFTAPTDGTYTIQIAGFAHPPQADVNYTGGGATVYRLHLSTGPVVTHFHPFAVSADQPTPVILQGYNLDPARRATTIDPKSLRISDGRVLVSLPDSIVPLQPILTKAAPSEEQEPNNEASQATKITRGTVGGLIHDRADIDRFAIELKKGEKLQANVYSTSIGIPLDPLIRIEGPDGKVIVENDDFDGSSEPLARWTASADGIYQIIVTDTLQEGGPRHHYVLEVSDQQPSVKATLTAAQPIILTPGETKAVKLAIKRQGGWTTPLTARVSGLPGGITAPEVVIGEKDAEVELKLTAAPDAPLGNQAAKFSVISTPPAAEGASTPTPVPGASFTASIPLRGDLLRGTSLLDATDALWICVTSPPPPPEKPTTK